MKWAGGLDPATGALILSGVVLIVGSLVAAASLLAAIAPNTAMLITARVLQGVAGALLTTNSLALLRHVKALAPQMVAKSGLMVGLGESEEDLLDVFRNMRAHNIDVLTVGQYLRPTKSHAEVIRYYRPEEFVRLKEQALAMGFGHVEAGPMVRSSYHADEQVPARKNLLAG